ncbi:hypothetical protein [Pseudacidovorax intermedius]|uniref:Uncharacterized protein n=1 Tax=Pseudacidovorax intermedius TaxID=433924 RepID=A0A147GM12_9BURK|nr:hypothetical protein [Pseudacidovorax intermedius]KTT14578.1 hypothetical protein NS331_23155 [Pseudacidovorax intermedius]
MKLRFLAGTALALAAAVLLPSAHADDGHGHDAAPAAPAAAALPRFALESDGFELVGVRQGHALTLYLDRHDDNQPVNDARIELQVGDKSYTAEPQGEGTYDVELDEATAEATGELPLLARLTVGATRDELRGEWHIEAADSHDHDAGHAPAWRRLLPWGAAALVLIAAAAWLLRRRPAPGAAA